MFPEPSVRIFTLVEADTPNVSHTFPITGCSMKMCMSMNIIRLTVMKVWNVSQVKLERDTLKRQATEEGLRGNQVRKTYLKGFLQREKIERVVRIGLIIL
jgi:hypothetical protein